VVSDCGCRKMQAWLYLMCWCSHQQGKTWYDLDICWLDTISENYPEITMSVCVIDEKVSELTCECSAMKRKPYIGHLAWIAWWNQESVGSPVSNRVIRWIRTKNGQNWVYQRVYTQVNKKHAQFSVFLWLSVSRVEVTSQWSSQSDVFHRFFKVLSVFKLLKLSPDNTDISPFDTKAEYYEIYEILPPGDNNESMRANLRNWMRHPPIHKQCHEWHQSETAHAPHWKTCYGILFSNQSASTAFPGLAETIRNWHWQEIEIVLIFSTSHTLFRTLSEKETSPALPSNTITNFSRYLCSCTLRHFSQKPMNGVSNRFSQRRIIERLPKTAGFANLELLGRFRVGNWT
jgi:hypothetical protein